MRSGCGLSHTITCIRSKTDVDVHEKRKWKNADFEH